MSHGVVIPDEEVFIAHKHRKEMAKEGDDGKNTFKLRTTTLREFTIVRGKLITVMTPRTGSYYIISISQG